MTDVFYRVILRIERFEKATRNSVALIDDIECAMFKSSQEARDFVTELRMHHCPCVTGEADVLNDLTAPELFTAGD